MKKFLVIVAVMVLVGGCTKKEEGAGGGGGTQATGETNISIATVGETMTFDKTDLTVPAGQEITLTMKNNSTTLQHNWVLTQQGKADEVGMAGIKAGPTKQFIPDTPAVLAHTKMIDVGGTDTVKFKAPPLGDYPYICTNAGHHVTMRGALHSK